MKKAVLDKSVEYIKSWLEFKYSQEEVPGLVVAISHKDKVVLNEAYGYANLEDKQKMTTDHVFRIASHSKTFTATAIIQLQEQSQLRIDDYIADHLEWLKDHNDKRWHKVTIRQLLSHGAGVIRDGNNADYWQLERPFPDEEQLKEEILEAKLVIDNNVRHKYSNYGYSLLGLLIEAVSGQSYDDFVTENIINPLELKATYSEYIPELDDKLVTGYSGREVNKTRLPIAHADTRAMAAATGFCSTAKDLCTYFTAQFVGSSKLLDDESKKEMQRTHLRTKNPGQDNEEDYGLGFEIEYLGDRKTISHGGGFPGYITKTLADPKDEIVVTVLTNCLGSPAGSAAKGIFSIFDYFSDNLSDSDKPKQDFSKFEGRYMSLWGMTDIVSLGDKITSVYPNSWQPFKFPNKLEHVKDSTFKVVDTGSFSSEQELVIFNIKGNGVETVTYTGTTMWPEKDWLKKQSDRVKVSL